MTILEALRVTTESITSWVESKFLKKTDVDTALSATSENPVQNKVVNTEIENLKTSIENLDVTEQINEAIGAIDYPVDSVNNKTGAVVLTADDLGVYVHPDEPTDAEVGAIWIDTANDPSYMPPTIPEITEADNGKVLMVVNGALQLVNLNLSVDANGVLSV